MDLFMVIDQGISAYSSANNGVVNSAIINAANENFILKPFNL